MQEHLADLHTYYFLDPEDKLPIKPISEIDCEIVEYIAAILEKTGHMVLSSLVGRWKKDPDETVLDALEFFISSEQLDEEMKDKSGDKWDKLLEKMKRSFVTINEDSFVINHIHSIKRGEGFDDKPYYTILINKEEDAPAQFQWYINKELRWNTFEAREKAFKELKSDIIKHTLTKFL